MKNKTYEQRRYKRKLTLGEYLKKRIESGDEVNTTFHLIKVPTADELDFYIQQYKIKEGHSEWSERFQRNFWVEDED
jgi:hypothetical protein|tara:strand:+ start:34 stop:264 length:231 start_codon:yes stop_codon:yes gene_type:complete